MKIFLLMLSVNGIKSIEKRIEMNFYDKGIRKFNPMKNNVKGIFGPNGIGKTSFIKGVDILKKISTDFNYLSDNTNLTILKKLINKKLGYFEIEVKFLIQHEEKNKYDIYRHYIKVEKISFEDRKDELKITLEKVEKLNSKGIVLKEFVIEKGEVKSNTFYKNEKIQQIIVEKTKNLLEKRSILSVIGNVSILASILRNGKFNFSTLKLLEFSNSLLNISSILLKNKNDFEKKLLELSYKNFFAEEEEILKKTYVNKLRTIILEVKNINFDIIKKFYKNLTVKLRLDDNHREYAEREETKDFQSKEFHLQKNEGNYNYLIDKENIETLEKILEYACKFLKIFKSSLNSIEYEKKEVENKYYISILFVYNNYKIDYEFESSGMKSLFDLFIDLIGLSLDEIVFIDEIDTNIHDIYLNKLIEFFAEEGKGQLVFTAHNITLLETLKKYKHSIDFINENMELVPWVKNGNYTPFKQYKEGYIRGLPFNVDEADFYQIFTINVNE